MAEEKKKGFNLAEALGAVSELNTGAEGREKLQYIDIQKIHPDPGNFYSLDGVEELAGNIELIGLQQPLRVRPDPQHEGEYIIVSGHRRRAAIELLVNEGKEAFRLVPCLIEGHQESDAMRELRLVLANSSTRKLTSADLATQAQKVEELLYKLKEEGTEFPGRMRDHVAEVCQVQASRLARLKVIREKLSPSWTRRFESDELAESTAYELTKLTKEDQEDWYQYLQSKDPSNVADITAWQVVELQTRVTKAKAAECLAGDYGPCLRKEERHREALGDGLPCSGCCVSCWNRTSCDHICPPAKKIVEKVKAEQEKRVQENEAELARTEETRARYDKICADMWIRLGVAMEVSGKDTKWLVDRLSFGYVTDEEIKDLDETLRGQSRVYAGDSPLEGASPLDIVGLADELGVTLDYLFFRTDNPCTPKEEKASATAPGSADLAEPTWRTGFPKRYGQYYCRIQLDGEQTMNIVLIWEYLECRWVHPSDNSPVPYVVLGWWPLPEDDPEDTEDAEDAEEDDEGDMDALWYGHEDDDDYLAESGEVLGADE